MMNDVLLLDSDVLIDYLRGVQPAISYLENQSMPLLISAISVAELFAGVRDGHERTALTTFLNAFEILPINQAIAEKGGLFRRNYGKSHHTGLADALIAATAEFHQATLITLNIKHFPMLENAKTPYQK